MEWCQGRDLDPVRAPTTEVLEFLQSLVRKELKVNTVKGYITAISMRHCKVEIDGSSHTIANLPAVMTWVRGLAALNPEPRVIVPSWCLEVVLSALKKPPYYPILTADLKHLTLRTVFLLALTSARRASEIHAIRSDTLQWNPQGVTAYVDASFLPKVASQWHCNQPIYLPAMREDADPELRKLCVRTCLNAYLKATQNARAVSGVAQLFLCYGKQKLGQPVSKQRISSWMKEVIADCYERTNLPPPSGVQGHQVRKMATSWADLAMVDPQKICEAATWRSSNMFARHYRLNLLHEGRMELGTRVLALAASKPAEVALKQRLAGYTIPKVSKPRSPNQRKSQSKS